MSEPIDDGFEAFATEQDLINRYGEIPAGQIGIVDTLLEDASQMLIDRYPAAVARATERTLKRIVCRMVWEALDHSDGVDTPVPGADSMQMGVGIFQRTWKLQTAQGRLFVSKEDRLALKGTQRAANIDLLTHLGPGS
ncbi:MAG: hypothetical protein J0H73_13945 [Salana multivorans]|uniref:hypothetical protein n=1 Tax=Salana multivorans TaxID=120377 RepID=UPI0009619335|nr:hypothetical protein [Salana multivorans]MBN8883403.1 hypothetical protein [Salana multivorans]OJX94082.1 MAG: hypothetical protein BGO96_09760 [Micrococcales bacterium 73-15]